MFRRSGVVLRVVNSRGAPTKHALHHADQVKAFVNIVQQAFWKLKQLLQRKQQVPIELAMGGKMLPLLLAGTGSL